MRSRLSAQSTRALLCVGAWLRLDLIRPADTRAVTALSDVEDDGSDYEMEEGWDRIERALAVR